MIAPTSRVPWPLAAALRSLALGWLDLRERWSAQPATAVLILAHMRSGSTLLQHLLISHPDVIGGGERNVEYHAPKDLRRLAVDSYYHRRQLLHRRPIAVDQINHTRLLDDPALLNLPEARAIFLIRDPEPAIASMVEVLGERYGMTLEQAVSYYRTRVSDLARLAGGLTDPMHGFFITYEALIDRTQPTLEALSRFLQLSPVLTADYRTFHFTGRAGDPSPTIQSGKVVRPPLRSAVLSPTLAAELSAHHTQTCLQLREICGAAVV